MIDINIYESQTCKTVSFGRKGENLARRIMFELSALIAEFGAGSFEWVIRRPHESTVYIAVNKEQDGNTAILNLTATETAISGYGGLELRYYVDDVIVKTIVWRTSIAASLGTNEVPDPIEDYIDQMREIANEASESADAAGDSATQAATSAANAANSATDAAGYAANAAASASASADSATDSAASASAAHTSETNAANSATAAAGSASNASTSAANAAASSTNAASSATQAAGSATAAATSAAQAAASATAADESAQDIAASAAQIQTNKDDITELKNQINVAVGTDYPLAQTLVRYDSGSWKFSPNLTNGTKYRVELVPNTDFTCTTITIGTTAYAPGVVQTLDNNINCVNGTPIVYDFTANADNIAYIRMPSQASNFSSVKLYNVALYNRTVSYENSMILTDAQKETARANIGALSQDDIGDITMLMANGKIKKTVTGSTIFLTEKGIHDVTVPYETQTVKVYGRNRFNNNGATYTFSGYPANQTLTKENNGISVQCNVSQTGAYLYAYTEYTAEFTGKLFFSCEADSTGKIEDVCVLPSINGTSQTRLYGKGKLYEVLDVTVGDTVRLAFYTHMGTNAYNTVKYKNIMLAYGGLYDFEQYGAEQTYYMPTDETVYNTQTTSSSAQRWIKLIASEHQIPSSVYPPNNNTKAFCTVNGLPLATYNETYNMINGLGIASGGTIGIYYNGLNRAGVVSHIAENNVSITYRDGAYSEVTGKRNYEQGEIIVLTSTDTVTYYCDAEKEQTNMVCFGDSITGMFANGCDYPSMLHYMHDLNAINAGFSGSQLTDHSSANYMPFSLNRLVEAIVSNDFTLQNASPLVDVSSESYNPLYKEHLDNIKNCQWSNIEYVTLFYGTNDWGSNAILKSADDPSTTNKQRTNVEDAIIYSIGQLVTAYPWLKVIVITPYWRAITTGKDSNIDPNGNGEYLFDYAEYIGETAQNKYNVPVIELYRSLGANVLTNRYFTKDGTHPTEMTKRIIADRITATVEIY